MGRFINIQNFTTNKLTNINIHVMTDKELRLKNEYNKLLKEHEDANRAAKKAKQRMAAIRREIDPKHLLVDSERPDLREMKS